MPYKKYIYLAKDLEIVLNFPNRQKIIKFKEPTMYNLLVFEDLIEQEKYFEALKILKINISKNDFLSAPENILKNILKICYSWNKKSFSEKNNFSSSEQWFMPSILDLLGKRYGKTPLELLHEMTPTIFETYLAWFEFSMNLENNEKQNNFKFKQKAKISEDEMKKIDKIMERVNKFDF